MGKMYLMYNNFSVGSPYFITYGKYFNNEMKSFNNKLKGIYNVSFESDKMSLKDLFLY